jgi:hypothetical protein
MGSATGEGQWVTIRGRHVFIGAGEERRYRALKSYRPQTKAKLRRALEQEAVVARALGGRNLPDNEPFDVIAGNIAAEVKVIDKGKNAKITMHPESRARKEAYAKANGMRAITIAVDNRGSSPIYYFREGVGSFRLGSMERVTLSQLRGRR